MTNRIWEGVELKEKKKGCVERKFRSCRTQLGRRTVVWRVGEM